MCSSCARVIAAANKFADKLYIKRHVALSQRVEIKTARGVANRVYFNERSKSKKQKPEAKNKKSMTNKGQKYGTREGGALLVIGGVVGPVDNQRFFIQSVPVDA